MSKAAGIGTGRWETVTDPKAGDLAIHDSGELDPRTVTRLSATGTHFWLDVLGGEVGPLDVRRYRFERWVRPEATVTELRPS